MDFATWLDAMREGVLRDIPERDWKTVRALIVTSVGHEEVVPVDPDALERLRPEADTAWPRNMDLPDRRCPAP